MNSISDSLLGPSVAAVGGASGISGPAEAGPGGMAGAPGADRAGPGGFADVFGRVNRSGTDARAQMQRRRDEDAEVRAEADTLGEARAEKRQEIAAAVATQWAVLSRRAVAAADAQHRARAQAAAQRSDAQQGSGESTDVQPWARSDWALRGAASMGAEGSGQTEEAGTEPAPEAGLGAADQMPLVRADAGEAWMAPTPGLVAVDLSPRLAVITPAPVGSESDDALRAFAAAQGFDVRALELVFGAQARAELQAGPLGEARVGTSAPGLMGVEAVVDPGSGSALESASAAVPLEDAPAGVAASVRAAMVALQARAAGGPSAATGQSGMLGGLGAGSGAGPGAVPFAGPDSAMPSQTGLGIRATNASGNGAFPGAVSGPTSSILASATDRAGLSAVAGAGGVRVDGLPGQASADGGVGRAIGLMDAVGLTGMAGAGATLRVAGAAGAAQNPAVVGSTLGVSGTAAAVLAGSYSAGAAVGVAPAGGRTVGPTLGTSVAASAAWAKIGPLASTGVQGRGLIAETGAGWEAGQDMGSGNALDPEASIGQSSGQSAGVGTGLGKAVGLGLAMGSGTGWSPGGGHISPAMAGQVTGMAGTSLAASVALQARMDLANGVAAALGSTLAVPETPWPASVGLEGSALPFAVDSSASGLGGLSAVGAPSVLRESAATGVPAPSDPIDLREHLDQGREALGQRLGEALATRLMGQIERGEWQMRLSLAPDHLGPIDIDLQVQGQRVEAQFQVANTQTQSLIQDGLSRLREAVASSGMDLASVWVSGGGSDRDRGNPTPGQLDDPTSGADLKEAADGDESRPGGVDSVDDRRSTWTPGQGSLDILI